MLFLQVAAVHWAVGWLELCCVVTGDRISALAFACPVASLVFFGFLGQFKFARVHACMVAGMGERHGLVCVVRSS